MTLTKTLIGLSLLATALLAQAQEYRAGDLHVERPWSRAMPAVAPTAAVYFVVKNKGSEDDRMLGASSPIAGKAELHEHLHADGLMKMQQVQAIDIPAGGEVSFAPMGYHVMLFELKRQAKDGERFPLTLRFEKAGELAIEVSVHQHAPSMPSADQGMQHRGH